MLNLTPYLERLPRALSGGQRQRVAQGRAVVREPELFLFDEPLSNLDAKLRVQMRTEIKALHQRLHNTVIYVTHDQIEAMTLADRIVVMNAGRIEQVGTPFEIYNRPATPFVASFIGNLNILDAAVVDPAQGLLSVAGQEVRAAGPVSFPASRAKLSLRPEMLSLNEGVPGANSLHGTLGTVVFLGSIVRLGIVIGNREISLDRFNTPHLALPAVGSEVTISFPREACLVTEPEASAEGAQAALSGAV
jgi:putative spermidine/putrescine transport system ATP-binding protein